jgi:hypothetical protein
MLNQMLERDDAALDRVFQALPDPGRRLMVDRLSRGPASNPLDGHITHARVAQNGLVHPDAVSGRLYGAPAIQGRLADLPARGRGRPLG